MNKTAAFTPAPHPTPLTLFRETNGLENLGDFGTGRWKLLGLFCPTFSLFQSKSPFL